jgi:hypothetical protein
VYRHGHLIKLALATSKSLSGFASLIPRFDINAPAFKGRVSPEAKSAG